MGPKTIPDATLMGEADLTTIWIANIEAPRHMWTLREALSWIASLPAGAAVTLHRPATSKLAAAWVANEQIVRLWSALAAQQAVRAAQPDPKRPSAL